MITMAFSQMAFFLFVSMEEYGADDGLVIYSRSEFPEWISLDSAFGLYYWIFAILLLSLFFIHRLVHALAEQIGEMAASLAGKYAHQRLVLRVVGALAHEAGLIALAVAEVQVIGRQRNDLAIALQVDQDGL